MRHIRILRALRLNLRMEQEDTLHIKMSKAGQDPEVFKDPQGPEAEPERVASIYIAYKGLRLSGILRHLRILRALRLNLTREQEDILHIRLLKAGQGPEAYKDP